MSFCTNESTETDSKALFEKARSMRLELWTPDWSRLFTHMARWKGLGMRVSHGASDFLNTALDFLREVRLILYKTTGAHA